jgi:hypothetical protein
LEEPQKGIAKEKAKGPFIINETGCHFAVACCVYVIEG